MTDMTETVTDMTETTTEMTEGWKANG